MEGVFIILFSMLRPRSHAIATIQCKVIANGSVKSWTALFFIDVGLTCNYHTFTFVRYNDRCRWCEMHLRLLKA